MGFLVAALLLCVARGPREKRWAGWSGGWQIRKAGDVARKGDEEKGRAAADEEDAAKSSEEVSSSDGRETNVNVEIDMTEVGRSRESGRGKD